MTATDLRRVRFSTLYEAPSELSKDSPQLRKRLARKLYRTAGERIIYKLSQHLNDELCLEFFNSNSQQSWEDTFKRASLGQVLSAITEVPRVLRQERHSSFHLPSYLSEVNRIFQEESAAYYADDRAVVHPRPDEVYRRSYSATVAGLSRAGLEAAAAEVEKADRHLLEDPVDWGRAVYSVFMACENIFKVATEAKSLNHHAFKDKLLPVLEKRYEGEPEKVTAFNTSLVSGFYDWISACHEYRHASGEAMVSPPPPELAMQAISNGYSYARWLAEIYTYKQSLEE